MAFVARGRCDLFIFVDFFCLHLFCWNVIYNYWACNYLILQLIADWYCISTADRMASRLRRSDIHVRQISTLSPTRTPVTVNDWFDSLGLTEYSHLFAAYRSMQVRIRSFHISVWKQHCNDLWFNERLFLSIPWTVFFVSWTLHNLMLWFKVMFD